MGPAQVRFRCICRNLVHRALPHCEGRANFGQKRRITGLKTPLSRPQTSKSQESREIRRSLVKKSAWPAATSPLETFSIAGFAVAILSRAMKKIASQAALLLALALPAVAENWSFGASVGPFVFGDFLERRL